MSKEENRELTDKEERFCQEYVVDLNGSRAARASGYSIKACRQQAYRMLSKDYIKARISELQGDIAKTIGVTAVKTALEFKKIAFTNVADLKKNWEEFKNWEDLTEDERSIISEITHSKTTFGEDGEKVTIKIKGHDKLKALDHLNKMLGFDKSEEKQTGFHGTVNLVIGHQEQQLPSSEDDIEDLPEYADDNDK